ncbi:MAG: hypothetical protein COT91_04485 [Candidatus Doudnabacteria bacterium CG10_big_fil_rev_8_21_14_0_10_41_10]|uniref:Methyltransferase domain-containing protein n=1 Tax=Candidatus Doudnabacteria bacterium CG10_big_fil_rev_8_21_14_0_10_41_10 TaxID=1974551 RepID=A0A2H0VCP6_9BACT|nr:MAG: hypothetical protein COT91_04485 [Candidatus Doudnabacteria bacterium CG10_big_fil_rev_8_21_14_0_10_41_10]
MKQKFVNPENLLREAGLAPGMKIVDMGCGGGFFTLPAARIVGDQGQVWGVDVLEQALENIVSSARLNHLKNIKTFRCDLDSPGSCQVPELSCDFAMVSKVLPQLKHPNYLVREIYKTLKTGGKVLIVEWKNESTPFGPPQEQRMSQDVAGEHFAKQGFKFLGQVETDKYHYGLVFQK